MFPDKLERISMDILSKEQLEIIKSVSPKYVISGSVAMMIHLDKKTRNIGDIDIHYPKNVDISSLTKLNMYYDVSYTKVPYEIVNGIRVMKKECILEYKIRRLINKDASIDKMERDKKDIEYLFDLFNHKK